VLVALNLAQQLEDAGFEVIGPAATVDEAYRALQKCNCNAAILDINLRRGTSEPIAYDLIALGVPIIVVSAYAPSQHPVVFNGLPAFMKPVRVAALLFELKRVLQQT
jgi:DNA-binding response OmpR family regulator